MKRNIPETQVTIPFPFSLKFVSHFGWRNRILCIFLVWLLATLTAAKACPHLLLFFQICIFGQKNALIPFTFRRQVARQGPPPEKCSRNAPPRGHRTSHSLPITFLQRSATPVSSHFISPVHYYPLRSVTWPLSVVTGRHKGGQCKETHGPDPAPGVCVLTPTFDPRKTPHPDPTAAAAGKSNSDAQLSGGHAEAGFGLATQNGVGGGNA